MSFRKPAIGLISMTHSMLNVFMDSGNGQLPAYVVVERNNDEEADKQAIDLHDSRFRWFLDANVAGECFTELTAGRPLHAGIKGHTYDELKGFALAVA
jgi:hypothetical protein